MATVQSEGLGQWRVPMTPSGIYIYIYICFILRPFYLKPLINLRPLILGLMLFGWFISIYLIPFLLWEFHFLFTTSWFTSIFSGGKKYDLKQGLGVYVLYRYAMNTFIASWRPFTWNRSDRTTTSNTKVKDGQNYTSFLYCKTCFSITLKGKFTLII